VGNGGKYGGTTLGFIGSGRATAGTVLDGEGKYMHRFLEWQI
jgi:hypothetical protein